MRSVELLLDLRHALVRLLDAPARLVVVEQRGARGQRDEPRGDERRGRRNGTVERLTPRPPHVPRFMRRRLVGRARSLGDAPFGAGLLGPARNSLQPQRVGRRQRSQSALCRACG